MRKNLNPALASEHEDAKLDHRGNTPTWVLLCDSGSYKLFVNHGRNDGLRQIEGEERNVAKTTDLVSNQRGRNKASEGAVARHAYEPPTDPREKEKSDFITEVAEKINARESDFARLIIAAPPSALHGLRQALSAKVKSKIVGELNKDLMHENASTLPHFIKEIMELKNSDDYMQDGCSQTGAA